jgi:hypothetical protein
MDDGNGLVWQADYLAEDEEWRRMVNLWDLILTLSLLVNGVIGKYSIINYLDGCVDSCSLR